MISKAQIKDLSGKREYYTRIKDEIRLKRLNLEEKYAWRDDLTQPSDSRFRTLYPDSYKDMQKTTEAVKKDAIKDKVQRDTLLHQFRHNSGEKKALINLFNKEDGRKHNSK